MNGKIQISPDHPRYWQYKGQPTLLLGGSVEDNLFQISGIREHLDLLQSVGGNYVRCTMSCRDPENAWPFAKVGDLYDLDVWDLAFWQRFNRFLLLTAERDIIVQIEVWDRFDYAREFWAANPFNPLNNSTYTAEESGLPTVVEGHAGKNENSFFRTIPAEDNQLTVLKYQQRLVDEYLRYALAYGHVLYCMDNETSATASWGAYWSSYIKARAAEVGATVETTEMWDAHDLADPQHRNTFDHPELYSFVDVSQNNHQVGQAHWDNMQAVRARLNPLRPMNNVKIYGADGFRFGDTRDGTERFWRNIIGGMASARFHRPPAGIGLDETAQAHLKSARMLTDRMRIFDCEPRNDLLRDRADNAAYLTARPGVEYALYFPDGQPVGLDLATDGGIWSLGWLDIAASAWREPVVVQGGQVVALTPPGRRQWAALLQRPAA